MDQQECWRKLDDIIDDSKTGVLATTDASGCPRLRWMVPALLPGRIGVIYAVSAPGTPKIAQLTARPEVEWMIQTRALTQAMNLRGRMNVLDFPAIRREVLEVIGRRLSAFWKYPADSASMVVLETVVSEACYYIPMKGTMVVTSFLGR